MNEALAAFMNKWNQYPSKELPDMYIARPPKLLNLFEKYNIRSIFDSGCQDLQWMKYINYESVRIKYIGGEISANQVARIKELYPDKEFLHHDCTTDPFPKVDLLLSNDVMIHLNNSDRLRFLQNFAASDIEYLLMTCSGPGPDANAEPVPVNGYPFSNVHWAAEPWNLPEEIDAISDYPNDRRLKLWRRSQLIDAINNIKI